MPATRRSLRSRVPQTVATETGSPETPSTTTRSSSNKTSVVGGTDTPATSLDEEYEVSKTEMKSQRTTLRRSTRNSFIEVEAKKEEEPEIDLQESSLKRKASEVFVEIVTKKIESAVPRATKKRASEPANGKNERLKQVGEKRRTSEIQALAKSKRNTRKRKARSDDENDNDEDQVQNDDDLESILTGDEIEYNEQGEFLSDGSSDFDPENDFSDGFASDGSDDAYANVNWNIATSRRKGKAAVRMPKHSPRYDEDVESAMMNAAIELSKHTYDEELKDSTDAGPSDTNGEWAECSKTVERTWWPEDDIENLRYFTRTGKERWRRKLSHAERTAFHLRLHHPELKTVWSDLESLIKVIEPQKAEQPDNLKVKLLPFQQESLYWMREQERGVWAGGLLADEMGMGKTIQTLALIASDKRKPNLIVAPTVAIMQWRNEIEAHTVGSTVAIWHGASREANLSELKKYNFVLTTYAVLESAFRKQENGFKRSGKIVKEKSAMHQIEWHRVVLDEAHNIKERSTNTAKATWELKAKYKWCLSGTPLQNRVGELFSMIRFLGGDPFSYYFCKQCDCKSLHWRFSDKKYCDDCGHSPMQHTCYWNSEILGPIQKNGLSGPGDLAFKKLRILLDRMMLRRTKVERADDLGLPPRIVIVRRDYFSPEEKELYTSLFSDAKRQFSTFVDQGTLLNNYSNIFSLLTRMRQMACHPDLVLKSKQNARKFGADEGEATICRLCNDIAEDAIQSKCRHIFDRECIKQYIDTSIESNPVCPVCHLPLTIDLDAPALELGNDVDETTGRMKQGILGRVDISNWRSSSKIEALVEELTKLREQDATTKSLVFSQFVNFLDLIAFRLQKAGFSICRLEGTMSPQARDATIKHFMSNVQVTVFLVSLKAGGVALNLTEASRVYLMDSWWNPAVEFQAMDRIHRLGQHRPVQVVKLVIEDSIESRIVQLQEKKSAMINATLSADNQAMGRLTPQDLSFLFRL